MYRLNLKFLVKNTELGLIVLIKEMFFYNDDINIKTDYSDNDEVGRINTQQYLNIIQGVDANGYFGTMESYKISKHIVPILMDIFDTILYDYNRYDIQPIVEVTNFDEENDFEH